MKNKLKDCCTYIFVDGIIVIGENKFKSFEEVEIINNDRISIEPCQLGPMVCIYNNKDINTYHSVPDTMEFINKDPEGIYSKYLALIKNYLK